MHPLFTNHGVTDLMNMEDLVFRYPNKYICIFQGGSRPVYQFHFTAWPDSEVPELATSLLDFRRKVRSHDDDAKGPLVVHCRYVNCITSNVTRNTCSNHFESAILYCNRFTCCQINTCAESCKFRHNI